MAENSCNSRRSGPAVLASLGLALACPLADAEPPRARPLSLKEAVQLVLQQNPERLIAGLALSQQKEEQAIARSALLPQVSLRWEEDVRSFNQQTITELPHPIRIGPFQTIKAGPSVSVDLSLARLRQYRASRQDVQTATNQETATREEVTARVVTEYLLVLRAIADRNAAVARVDLAQRLFDQARQLQQTGVGTDIDALRAQVELQNEKQRLIDATTQRNTAIYALGATLALPRGEDPSPTDTMEFYQVPEFSQENLVREALQNRPEVKALLSAESAAAERVKAAGDERWPSLQISGFYEYQARQLNDGIGGYGFSYAFSMPLWTGGRIGAEEQRERLELQSIGQRRRDLENAVEQQVKTALDQSGAARESVAVAELGLALARQEVERATRRFEAGVATNIEVVTAQDALARADDNRIQALYRFNQARADLARSVGNAEDVYGH